MIPNNLEGLIPIETLAILLWTLIVAVWTLLLVGAICLLAAMAGKRGGRRATTEGGNRLTGPPAPAVRSPREVLRGVRG